MNTTIRPLLLSGSRRGAGILFAALCLGRLLSSQGAAAPLQIEGITEPYRDVTLGLADPGIIHREFYREGDWVEQGGVILEFDKRLEQLEVARRKAVMNQDKLVLDSTHQLFQTTKSVSKQDLAKAEAEYDVSAAQYAIASQELTNRSLVAPFSGRVVKILLHSGAACAPYQPLVRLVDVSRCYFIGHVEGPAASNVRVDEPVKMQLAGGATLAGKICFVSPVADPASGLVRIKALFENAGEKIRPGLAAMLIIE